MSAPGTWRSAGGTQVGGFGSPSRVPVGGPSLMPNLVGASSRQALRMISGIGLMARVSGSGFVVRQSPAAGTPIEPGGWASVELKRVPPAGDPVEAVQ